ncbi:hypothetical protein [Heliorestis convoluta]|uniref:WD40 repeat domain-containing protein n=1 Tax=Heliorestis convoluta TaxID=356322 RepID=A0A5Q2N3B4_9FIRM|nr:hypothetical protein [Heliorestis convoluta]QGG46820.1 hypothetical protein FTV88_0641 [Heliorestis convoluta]
MDKRSDLSTDQEDYLFDTPIEREFKPSQKRIVSVSGYKPVEPTLPPYKYRKKRKGPWNKVLVATITVSIFFAGAIAFSSYAGIISFSAKPFVESNLFAGDDSVEKDAYIIDRTEDLFVADSIAGASNTSHLVAHKWEQGLLLEQTWTISEIPGYEASEEGEAPKEIKRSIQIIPLLSGDFLAVSQEEGILKGIDMTGAIVWSKGPEEWGVSGDRVLRKWTSLARSENGRVAAFTEGIESVVWWSNLQRPFEEHPLPEEGSAIILGVTANNEFIRWHESGFGFEIVNKYGDMVKEIATDTTYYTPIAIQPLLQKRLLAATLEGLVYVVGTEGQIEREVGKLPLERGIIQALAVDLEGYIFLGTERELIVWSSRGKEVYAMPFENSVASLAFLEKGKLLVGDRKGQVHVFTAKEPQSL